MPCNEGVTIRLSELIQKTLGKGKITLAGIREIFAEAATLEPGLKGGVRYDRMERESVFTLIMEFTEHQVLWLALHVHYPISSPNHPLKE